MTKKNNKFPKGGFLYYLLTIGIPLMNTVDGLSTAFFVREYGSHLEQNPIARWLIDQIGIWSLVPKLLVGFLLFILLWKYWVSRKSLIYSGIFVFVLYFIVTLTHIYNFVLHFSQ